GQDSEKRFARERRDFQHAISGPPLQARHKARRPSRLGSRPRIRRVGPCRRPSLLQSSSRSGLGWISDSEAIATLETDGNRSKRDIGEGQCRAERDVSRNKRPAHIFEVETLEVGKGNDAEAGSV